MGRMSDEDWSQQSRALDTSEWEKEEGRVNLVLLFKKLDFVGSIFLHLGEFTTVVDSFLCGFREVLSGHYMW